MSALVVSLVLHHVGFRGLWERTPGESDVKNREMISVYDITKNPGEGNKKLSKIWRRI